MGCVTLWFCGVLFTQSDINPNKLNSTPDSRITIVSHHISSTSPPAIKTWHNWPLYTLLSRRMPWRTVSNWFFWNGCVGSKLFSWPVVCDVHGLILGGVVPPPHPSLFVVIIFELRPLQVDCRVTSLIETKSILLKTRKWTQNRYNKWKSVYFFNLQLLRF